MVDERSSGCSTLTPQVFGVGLEQAVLKSTNTLRWELHPPSFRDHQAQTWMHPAVFPQILHVMEVFQRFWTFCPRVFRSCRPSVPASQAFRWRWFLASENPAENPAAPKTNRKISVRTNATLEISDAWETNAGHRWSWFCSGFYRWPKEMTQAEKENGDWSEATWLRLKIGCLIPLVNHCFPIQITRHLAVNPRFSVTHQW